MLDFLRGLSRDELECLAEFEGAWTLESLGDAPCNPYRMLGSFFDTGARERWHNADDCAHKTFILLAWLEFRTSRVRAAIHTNTVQSV